MSLTISNLRKISKILSKELLGEIQRPKTLSLEIKILSRPSLSLLSILIRLAKRRRRIATVMPKTIKIKSPKKALS